MKEVLQRLADIALCTSNDFHLMHLNYNGSEFDTMHKKVLQKYYEEAAEDYDTWAEAAAMYGAEIQTPNEAAARQNWESSSGMFDYPIAAVNVNGKLREYCAALVLVFDAIEKEHNAIAIGIANTLQTRIEYWSKELAYFNARRMA
jgi:DNA-binding ferritin-like protein